MRGEGPWAAGLALAGGVLVVAAALLVVVAVEWPWLLVGLDPDAVRFDRTHSAPFVPRVVFLAWGLGAGLLAAVSGWRMAGRDTGEPRLGAAAVLGGVMALPVLGAAFLGSHAAVLGGSLHLVAARRRRD